MRHFAQTVVDFFQGREDDLAGVGDGSFPGGLGFGDVGAAPAAVEDRGA